MICTPPDPASVPAEHAISPPRLIDLRAAESPPAGSDAAGHAAGTDGPTAGGVPDHQPGMDDCLAPVWADGIVFNVPIDRIVASRHRARYPSTPRALASLVESLRTPGRILPPCPAVVLPDGASFELLDGHRIIEAGRALGWEEATLLLVSVTDVQAALWTILSDSHRRRYTWWDKVRAMRIVAAVAADSMTGRAISCLSGWSESTVSEARTAAAVLTPDVLVLAGVDEGLDRDRLMRLRRRDGRYIVRGGSPEEIAVRLREALDGRTPAVLADRDARERAACAISSALYTDGRWRVEVDLADLTGADLRALRRELVRQFDDACAKGRRAPAGRRVAPVKQVTTPPSASAVQVDRGVPVATHAVSLRETGYREPAPQPPTTDGLG